MNMADDEDIYDIAPNTNETVSDLKKIRSRFEQTKPKPQIKPKVQTIPPYLPPKVKGVESAPLPPKTLPPKTNKPSSSQVSQPVKSVSLKDDKSGNSPTAASKENSLKQPSTKPKPDLKNIAASYTQVEKKKPSTNADVLKGIDNKMYKRLPPPTDNEVAPEKPVRPAHVILSDVTQDDDDWYDEVALPSAKDGSYRPVSVIPDMTSEEEEALLARKMSKKKPEEQEIYNLDDDTKDSDLQQQENDIYETF